MFLFFVAFSPTIFAQSTNLFTSIPPFELVGDQLKVSNHVHSLPYYGNSHFIRLSNITEFETLTYVSVTLPELENPEILFEVKDFEINGHNDYSWHGTSADGGEIYILTKPEGTIGFIDLRTKYYEIFPLGNSNAILMEHNQHRYIEGSCLSTPSAELVDEFGCFEADCGAAVVDVLAIVTPDAQQQLNTQVGSLANLFLLYGFNFANIALSNSDIKGKSFRTRVINFTPTLTTDDISKAENFLSAINNNTSGIPALMNTFNADLVVVLINLNLFNSSNVGIFGGAFPSQNVLFCEIDQLSAPRYTFIHELGHRFNCEHDLISNPAGNGAGPYCAHGFFFGVGSGQAGKTPTIMAQPGVNGSLSVRALNFSNPDVNVGGVPTGTDKHNNASMIKVNMCAVSANQPTSIWDVKLLTIKSCSYNNMSATFAARITEPILALQGNSLGANLPIGLPGYTYKWFWSTTGKDADRIALLGNTESITIDNPIDCEGYFVHVEVGSSDKLVERKVVKVNTSCCKVKPKILIKNTTNKTTLSNSDLVIYPNPTNGIVNIAIPYTVNMNSSIEISNAQNIVLRHIDLKHNDQNIQINTDNFPSGMYYVKYQDGFISSHQTLIIQK